MRVQSCVWQIFLLFLVATGCNGLPSIRPVTSTSQSDCPFCNFIRQLLNQGSETNRRLGAIERKIDALLVKKNCSGVSKDCADLYKCGNKQSGAYTIQPDNRASFDVYCDMTTAGGGWTVFQKRFDGSVDFYKGWAQYKNGFGILSGEFWLGLDKINQLTNARQYRLHVDLQETNGNTAYAEYGYFAVSSERTNYQLSLGTYSGDAGDSLSYHRGWPFSTKDRDNDHWGKQCAQARHGAWWWYESCLYSNLNGKYLHGQHSSYANGINWYHWKGHKYSAARSEMKIRPVNF